MKTKKIIRLIMFFALMPTSYGLIWHYYDWKLSLFLFLWTWGNNLSEDMKREQREVKENEKSVEYFKSVWR